MDLNIVSASEVEQPKADIDISKEVKNVVTPSTNTPVPKEPFKIKRAEFRNLTECIGLMEKLSCMDCDIREGFVRQADNFGNWVVEMDLNTILNNRSFSISVAKEKYAMMKALDIDDSLDWSVEDLVLKELAKSYQISDRQSTITFKKPVDSLMGNTFITKKQMDSKSNLSDNNLVFSLTIEPYMSKRIKTMCDSLGTDIVNVEMKDKKASLFIRNKNNTDEMVAKVICDFELNKTMPQSNFFFTCLPFKTGATSDISFKLFTQEKHCLTVFEQQIFSSIPLKLFYLVKVSNS
jgi:hypothetical protein